MDINNETPPEREHESHDRTRELSASVEERERIIRALNEALERDLDELFEDDRAA
ncbi:MAG: hypothetical protein WEB52_12585 [Dehalococcoidia bacterium]